MSYTPIQKHKKLLPILDELDKLIDTYPDRKSIALFNSQYKLLLGSIDSKIRVNYIKGIPYRGALIHPYLRT
jgi:hypothetical protein